MRNDLRGHVRFVRMYRKAAQRCGLIFQDVRDHDDETGDYFHGYQCDNYSIGMINGEWWPFECHHYRGSIYEPPSDEWGTIDSAFADFADALDWLVKQAHESRLNSALEDEGQYLHWHEMKDDHPIFGGPAHA